jgi:hypothetical protein
MLVRAFIMARPPPGVGRRGAMGEVHACPGEVRPGDLVDLPYWPVGRDTWDVARGG